MVPRLRRLAPLVLLLSAWCSLQLQAVPDAPQRIVAIGDVHGNFDALVRILGHVHLVDGMKRWSGGRTVLVQTGDFTDRGPHVRAVMDLLMSLQKSAPRTGGEVHVLLGNHEAMNLLGLTQDISTQAFAEFADSSSDSRRNEEYDRFVSLCAAQRGRFVRPIPLYQAAPREEWLNDHPRGFIEYFEALAPDGGYGRWLRSLPVAVKVGDTIFMHAGIDPERAPGELDEVSDKARKEIERFDELRKALIGSGWALPSFTIEQIIGAAQVAQAVDRSDIRWNVSRVPAQSWLLLDPEGPLWFRGLAMRPSQELEAPLAKLLERYGAHRFVLGHTVMSTHRIGQRLGGRVVLIDTGMLSSYFRGGRASALEIADGHLKAIYDDGTAAVGSPTEPAPGH